MENPSLIQQLRSATEPVYARIAALPFFYDLEQGTLPKETLATFLRAMHIVQSGLERGIRSAGDRRLHAALTNLIERNRELKAEVEQLPDMNPSANEVATAAASDLVRQLARRVRKAPLSLIGALYVFEARLHATPMLTARMGQRELAVGSRYLACAAGGRDDGEFAERLNLIALAEHEVRDVVLGAEAASAVLEQVVASLYPLGARWEQVTARQLNPYAGDHPVTQDLGELACVRKAGLRSLAEFPYLVERYGERGRKFTSSDGAWLVTLRSLPQRAVDQEISWLARVLAARGMPSVILERHLGCMQLELEAAFSTQRDYRALARAARRLGKERSAVVSRNATKSISERFDRTVDAEWRNRLGCVGSLLVCAVSDEALGRSHAIRSLRSWLVDPARFSGGWIEGVDAAIASARACAHGWGHSQREVSLRRESSISRAQTEPGE